MTRSGPFLAALLLLTTGCATGTTPAHTALPGCADTLLIGVRGSGESVTDDHAIGATLDDLYQRLTTYSPTAVYGLPYAAQNTSANTVADAATRLAALIHQRHRQCPTEHLILAGFSLGAEILGDTLQHPDITDQPSLFTAAAVLGDPRFNPTDTATAAGNYNPQDHGDRPRPPYPNRLADRIRSYCRAHDPICQNNDPAKDKAQHGRYAPDQTSQAAAYIQTRS